MSTLALPQHKTEAPEIRFKQILMATDFSAISRRALMYAAAMARYFEAGISLVHAIPPEPVGVVPMLPSEPDPDRIQAKEEMRRLEEFLPGGLPHETVVAVGDVAKVVSSAIEREQADLLVLGTHGRGVLGEFALGSVAEELLRVASCPVLTVGPHVAEPGPDAANFKTIIFATDFGTSANRAFPLALALAEGCGAKLVLVHMIPPYSFADMGVGGYCPAAYAAEDLAARYAQLESESLQKLKELIPPGANLQSEPEYVVREEFLPDGILEAAAVHKADLIVMGAVRTRSPRIAAHLPWSTVHNLLRDARCPVLTVRD